MDNKGKKSESKHEKAASRKAEPAKKTVAEKAPAKKTAAAKAPAKKATAAKAPATKTTVAKASTTASPDLKNIAVGATAGTGLGTAGPIDLEVNEDEFDRFSEEDAVVSPLEPVGTDQAIEPVYTEDGVIR